MSDIVQYSPGVEGEVNGVRLWYEVSGDGEPVIQIHGAGFGHFNFAPATPELSKRFRVIDYDMRAGSWQLMKQDRIASGYDPTRFQSERVFASAADGARVPISLVYQKGAARDGSNPLLLYGYGSYGSNVDPSFDSKRRIV